MYMLYGYAVDGAMGIYYSIGWYYKYDSMRNSILYNNISAIYDLDC
jgi:hypothetical protein